MESRNRCWKHVGDGQVVSAVNSGSVSDRQSVSSSVDAGLSLNSSSGEGDRESTSHRGVCDGRNNDCGGSQESQSQGGGDVSEVNERLGIPELEGGGQREVSQEERREVTGGDRGGSDSWEVEQIKGKRKSRGRRGYDYLVRWKGDWGDEQEQWVSQYKVRAPERVREFEQEQKKEEERRRDREEERKHDDGETQQRAHEREVLGMYEKERQTHTQTDDEERSNDTRQQQENRTREIGLEKEKTREVERERREQHKHTHYESDGRENESESVVDTEEIKSFLAGIETEKLTDKSIQKRDDYPKFIEAKNEEIERAIETGTIRSVNRGTIPRGTKIYSSMWVHKIKPATALEGVRYRSRLCVLGNNQQKDSYSETFAAVAKVKTFRLLLSISVFFGLRMTQIDISNAFMYADIDRDIYMYPPQGYENLGILKLDKSLYGLKQAPRLWFETVSKYIVRDLGFEQLRSDTCCFKHPTKRCYILLYVDDICIFTKDEALRQEVVKGLESQFKLRNFDTAGVYVGLQMDWASDSSKVKIHQTAFIQKLLQAFNMEECQTVTEPSQDNVKLSRQDPVSQKMKNRPYRSLVGALLYTLGSRPDVAAAVRTVSQYMSQPADSHWFAAKRILRYLAGTMEKGVTYTRQEKYDLTAYTDSDWGSDVDDRRSVTGYVVYAQGGPITWKSKKQPTVARSACEAEYVALAETISELLWMKMTLTKLGVPMDGPMKVYIDIKSSSKEIGSESRQSGQNKTHRH